MIVSRETMDLAASGMFHVKHSGSAEKKNERSEKWEKL